jgi:hypothetical protein
MPWAVCFRSVTLVDTVLHIRQDNIMYDLGKNSQHLMDDVLIHWAPGLLRDPRIQTN